MNSMMPVLVVLVTSACLQDADARTPPTGQAVAPESAAAAPADGLCVEAHQQVLAEVASVVLQHGRGCVADTDCVLVETSVPCQVGCPLAVLTAERARCSTALAEYSSEKCPAVPTTCGIAPTCPPYAGVACVAGSCRPRLEGAASPDAG